MSSFEKATPAYSEHAIATDDKSTATSSRNSALLGFGTDEQSNEAPPSYEESLDNDLLLTQNCIPAPLIHITGDSRSPDLDISLPDRQKLYSFETDSTLVYHETAVHDLLAGSTLFRIRRRPIEAQPDGFWRYTAHAHVQGRSSGGGVKILEIDTDPTMLDLTKPWSTRLIFRHARTGDLDGLTLLVVGGNKTALNGEVRYQRQRVADIVYESKFTSSKGNCPGYRVRVHHQGLDPLLVSICAYVLDDRTMVNKRRHRESALAGVAGIGKGPGAGLAGAYALGSII